MWKIVVLAVFLYGGGNLSFCFAYGNNNTVQEIKSFSLVHYEEGGDRHWELKGRIARIEEVSVEIDDVSALSFEEDSVFKLKAREGSFNKNTHLLYLEGNVIVRNSGGTELKTDSLYWDTDKKEIFSETIVTIKEHNFKIKGKGVRYDLNKRIAEFNKDVTTYISYCVSRGSYVLSQKRIISCDGPFEIDYKKNKATFHSNVAVETVKEEYGNIFADRIDVYFNSGLNLVRCWIARGNVRIITEESVTYTDKAIYLADRGRLILPHKAKLVISGK